VIVDNPKLITCLAEQIIILRDFSRLDFPTARRTEDDGSFIRVGELKERAAIIVDLLLVGPLFPTTFAFIAKVGNVRPGFP